MLLTASSSLCSVLRVVSLAPPADGECLSYAEWNWRGPPRPTGCFRMDVGVNMGMGELSGGNPLACTATNLVPPDEFIMVAVGPEEVAPIGRRERVLLLGACCC